ncbi:MAG: hypothetical protein V1742_05615, partial [Pseudomonadota bacterium]
MTFNLIRPGLLVVLFLCLICGCTSVSAPRPTTLQRGAPQELTQEVTLLPVLDSRSFLPSDKYPDLRAPVSIVMPASSILEQGRLVWQREGLASKIMPYEGPEPESDSFTWTDFPLRALKTDLGLGLEIKSLSLEKTGHNALMPVQVFTDGMLLPFFALGQAATNGHVDLGGRYLPSSEIKFTFKVDLNCLSLKGGGHIYTKSYSLNLTDRSVSERRLQHGFYRSAQDGQNFGRQTAPRVIEEVFTRMARDPALANLPRLAELAWLRRVLAEPRIGPRIKADSVQKVTAGLSVPEFTAPELKIITDPNLELPEKIELAFLADRDPDAETPKAGFLKSYAVDPLWAQESADQLKLFTSACEVLLDALGRLNQVKMNRPLTKEEGRLEERIMAVLTRWGENQAANQLFRAEINKKGIDWSRKKAAVLLLARNLETLDNEEFVHKQIEERVLILSGKEAITPETAAFLAAVKGEAVLEEHAIPRLRLLEVLSGDDRWAAPLVLQALSSGDFDPQLIRLAGAMELPAALPLLLAALKDALAAPRPLSGSGKEQDIPLLPGDPRRKKTAQPDPVLLVRALGSFRDQPQVSSILRSLVELWRRKVQPDFGPRITLEASSLVGLEGSPDLAAEAAAALGRLADREAAEVLFWLWAADWLVEKDSATVRRASLGALEDLAGPAHKQKILE